LSSEALWREKALIYQILVRQQSDANWRPYGKPITDPFAAMRLVQQANQQYKEVTVLQADNLSALRALLLGLARGEMPARAASIAPALTATPRVSVRDEAWEAWRWEMEQGGGGDHDMPYRFELPLNPKVLAAWVSLMANRWRGAESATKKLPEPGS
jgi:hypothetical protein